MQKTLLDFVHDSLNSGRTPKNSPKVAKARVEVLNYRLSSSPHAVAAVPAL